jgi:hypothetical protein
MLMHFAMQVSVRATAHCGARTFHRNGVPMERESKSDRMPHAGSPVGIDGRPCSTCGSVGYPGDRFCACCGTQLLRLCRSCNAPVLQPVANYCTGCGLTLTKLENVVESETGRRSERV